MNDYGIRLREHLANYKRTRLGVSENGVWERTGQPYPHILPKALQKLNILETYRAEFWESLPKWNPAVKLHPDFHHLNSSQAMAFNLLYPLTVSGAQGQQTLLEALGLVGETVQANFESVPDPAEGTNFDFMLTLKSGARILCELKLSESDFGSAADDTSHRGKFNTVYQAKLIGKVSDECLKPDLFFRNYQVLRNICHLTAGSQDCLYLIFPLENTRLTGIKEFLDMHVHPSVRGQIRMSHLEEISKQIADLCGKEALLRAHFLLFREKYISGGS